MTKLHLIHKEFTLQYITLTFYYIYCTGHIQTISNNSIINVLTKYNKMNKMTKLYSLQSEFTLQYIALTHYYIVKDIHLDNKH